MIRSALGLSSLEVASTYVLGDLPSQPSLPEVPRALHPLKALEDAMLEPLQRGACFVTFSGGRDSSAVLAVAARTAERQGLPAPVPITLRFPALAGTDETAWQEALVRELRLPDWIRLEFHDELDMVGPIAQRVLRRHGILWPTNVHVQVPLLEAARGGTLCTGFDGDELFEGWRWARAAAILEGRARPQPRDAGRLALALAPAAVRRRSGRMGAPRLPWLRAGARDALDRRVQAERAAEPRAWDRRIEWYARRRFNEVMRRAIQLLADDAGAAVAHPLMDSRFLASVGRLGGRGGFSDRTAAMRQIFAGVLPERVLSRSTKGIFDDALWGSHSRDFVACWTGDGLPADIVDSDALRRMWRSPEPDVRADLLVQAAWLATVDGEVHEQVDGVVDGRGIPRTP